MHQGGIRMWTPFVCLFLTGVLLNPCDGHTLHLGRTCPDVQSFPNLSTDKILGIWFVVYQVDTSNTCQIWNITRSTTNSEQLVVEEARQLYFVDFVGINHKQSITANVDIPNPEMPGRMRIRWPTSFTTWTGKADFTVFDTDYDNYVAIFQCDRAGFLHRRDITILSKSPKLDDILLKRVKRLLEIADVGYNDLLKISHAKCRKEGFRDWHIDSELFGLLPHNTDLAGISSQLSANVQDYDISQVEILSDGIDSMGGDIKFKKSEGIDSDAGFL